MKIKKKRPRVHPSWGRGTESSMNKDRLRNNEGEYHLINGEVNDLKDR